MKVQVTILICASLLMIALTPTASADEHCDGMPDGDLVEILLLVVECATGGETEPASPVVASNWRLVTGTGGCQGTTEQLTGEVEGEANVGVGVGPVKVEIGGRVAVSGTYAIKWDFACDISSVADANGANGFLRVVSLEVNGVVRDRCEYSGMPDHSTCETGTETITTQGVGGNGIAIPGGEYPTSLRACWQPEVTITVEGVNRGWQDIGDPVRDKANEPNCETFAISYTPSLGLVPLVCNLAGTADCEEAPGADPCGLPGDPCGDPTLPEVCELPGDPCGDPEVPHPCELPGDPCGDPEVPHPCDLFKIDCGINIRKLIDQLCTDIRENPLMGFEDDPCKLGPPEISPRFEIPSGPFRISDPPAVM